MWIKLDDQWIDHPKIIRAGRDGRDTWLASITWCSKWRTDGYFPPEALPTLVAMAGVDVASWQNSSNLPDVCQALATRLLEVGLWEFDGQKYKVHDFEDFQPTEERKEAVSEARREAGRRGGFAKASKASKSLAKEVAKVWQKSAPSPSPVNPSIEGAGALVDVLANALADLKAPDAKNKPAIVAKVFTARYGDMHPPNYARLARMAGELSGDYLTLAQMINDSAKPDGDPHDYLQGLIGKSPAKRKPGKNGTHAADRPNLEVEQQNELRRQWELEHGQSR